GRTGDMFACQAYDVLPDVMTCAKALGCGVPVGAFVLNEKTANASLVPGDHGTTYGGNPFACAAVSKVFDLYEEEKIIEHVREITPYLEEKLDALVEKYDFIVARRGKGLMQGLVMDPKPVGEVVNKAIENGLLVISAGSNVLRLVPPLVITKEDIDEMIEKLEKSLSV
ncbi:MAG: aminotransferase class III-fold pyridoxal phosphate-dependent enzyme, partial [Clostridia bacterium]|nr:aminotransferase class III-fold pyridoxal phosphate-dependent enzyme [Clostridia bacterium]